LKHLNRALELDSSLPEALFNRALCYEAMSMPAQAKENWETYLTKEPDSEWAQLGREKLQNQ
jgi:hypothetical protein